VAPILSHPFRLAANGEVVTVEQFSDTANEEQIAVLMLTRVGERPMAPSFGIHDPAFNGFQPTELAAQLAVWGPPVTLADIAALPGPDGHSQLVTVEFD
jgi:hypothetical protein